jgi:hypothetical protein
MREQFRAELTQDGQFFPRGEDWKRWKEISPRGWYMFSPRKEGPPRKLNQNGLYWLRCEVLGRQNEVNLSKSGVHEYLMRAAGYAVPKKLRGETIYDRESSAALTMAEFSHLMKQQDILADFCNEGRLPEHYMELPTT